MHYDREKGTTSVSVYYNPSWHQRRNSDGKTTRDGDTYQYSSNNNRSNYVQSRCTSEIVLSSNWTDVDKKYTKIGHNGYRQKDKTCNVKHLTLNNTNRVNVHVGPSTSHVSVTNVSFTDEADGFFADKRSLVNNTSPLQAKQIVSAKGTVRGVQNRVRAGIVTFLEQQNVHRISKHRERGKIVIYTTSMSVIRQTFQRCRTVRKILQLHRVRYDDKDLFMNKANQRELTERLNTNTVTLPQVFVDGIHLGTAEDTEQMNEDGELKKILQDFEKITVKSSCSKCGEHRYVPCDFCHGSKKSSHRNAFTDDFCDLRCMQCDENGLLRCDMCSEQQE